MEGRGELLFWHAVAGQVKDKKGLGKTSPAQRSTPRRRRVSHRTFLPSPPAQKSFNATNSSNITSVISGGTARASGSP